jgi:hypothetical protein
MRHILKPDSPPDSIRDYVDNQKSVGHGLDYSTFSQTANPQGGSRGGQLCRELTAQQFGLCAYTGAGIDIRIGSTTPSEGRLKFRAHNEHLKPQSVCRQELTNAGKKPGVDLGDDMNHKNIVAALEVSGNQSKVARIDLFGATHRANDPVASIPTNPQCEQDFDFDEQGNIVAVTQDGEDTIGQLNLKHPTLVGWRKQAISTFVDAIQSRADAEQVLDRTTNPTNGILPEYCFAIRRVVQKMLELSRP